MYPQLPPANRPTLPGPYSSYAAPYVQNIIIASMKALNLLASLTFDNVLVSKVRDLETYLKRQIAKTKTEQQKLQKYKNKPIYF